MTQGTRKRKWNYVKASEQGSHREAGTGLSRRLRPRTYLAPRPSRTQTTHRTGDKVSQLAVRSLHFSSNARLIQSTDESN